MIDLVGEEICAAICCNSKLAWCGGRQCVRFITLCLMYFVLPTILHLFKMCHLLPTGRTTIIRRHFFAQPT
ncbi:hypothetical protein Pelo_6518 [Pelomyxa schiedti]|nr:hypothetical protein Pelo_6518 [Pelomyxa schiedti]